MGDNGRADVYGVDMAHGYHLRRPVLFSALPASLPAHEVFRLRCREDRICMDRLSRDLFVSGGGGDGEPVQRLPRRTVRPRRTGVRNLRLNLRVLRAASGDVRYIRADRQNAEGELDHSVVAAPTAEAHVSRLPPGEQIYHSRSERQHVRL